MSTCGRRERRPTLRGDLDRLQGRFDAAEEEFREAARLGFDPQPGSGAAAAGQRERAGRGRDGASGSGGAPDSGKRVELLCAATEILLALGETGEARQRVAGAGRSGQRQPDRSGVGRTRRGRRLDLAEGRPDGGAGPASLGAGAVGAAVRAPYEEARARVPARGSLPRPGRQGVGRPRGRDGSRDSSRISAQRRTSHAWPADPAVDGAGGRGAPAARRPAPPTRRSRPSWC